MEAQTYRCRSSPLEAPEPVTASLLSAVATFASNFVPRHNKKYICVDQKKILIKYKKHKTFN